MGRSAPIYAPTSRLGEAMPPSPTREWLVSGSHPATGDAVFAQVLQALQQPARLLDLGCGNGAFAQRMAGHYESQGWQPARYLRGADINPSYYQAKGVPFDQLDVGNPLPYATGAFDVVVCIELLEHTPNPYALFDEVYRILAPGGSLVFSVPNVMHAISRLSFLFSGFYQMYPPPSIKPSNMGRLCGHIMPLPHHYWDYGLRRSGFDAIGTRSDRTKSGAAWVTLALSPALQVGRWLYNRRLRRIDPALHAESAHAVAAANSWSVLTSRSLVFSARKPPAGKNA